MKRFLKTGLVIGGAVIVTALSIDAADTFSGADGTLLRALLSEDSSVCPDGMTAARPGFSFSCVDIYEASPATGCTYAMPQSHTETTVNLVNQDCGALSVPDVLPWRYITRHEADMACARAGKRLPRSEEWYQFAIGTPDSEVCNIQSDAVRVTKAHERCYSADGAYDVVGNVWEWVLDDVIDGQYQGRQLPESGYVAAVDNAGVALATNKRPTSTYAADYFWASTDGSYGMVRGGYYDSGEDGGLFATHAKIPAGQAGAAIGFRCVR